MPQTSYAEVPNRKQKLTGPPLFKLGKNVLQPALKKGSSRWIQQCLLSKPGKWGQPKPGFAPATRQNPGIWWKNLVLRIETRTTV